MSEIPRTPQAAPPSRVPWRGILIGCGILAVVGVLLTCLGGVILYRIVEPPENVVVTVSAPAELAVGQEGDLVVTLDNQRAEPVEVGDIDLADAYINAFTVVSTEPEPKSRSGYGFLGIQSFTFDTGLPAGSSRVFTFKLRALQPGVLRGDVDVSVDMGIITKVAETVVKDAAP